MHQLYYVHLAFSEYTALSMRVIYIIHVHNVLGKVYIYVKAAIEALTGQ